MSTNLFVSIAVAGALTCIIGGGLFEDAYAWTAGGLALVIGFIGVFLS
ncbi:hypothetical protein [Halomarina oriensis]|uniref:Uncharacterized protein n=1 Tax=Halomarina oriensis TaxID=671145 RepID=A0A6B0GQA6_9EURY|nr:hypothetical protein [Halomarina oriensis]MWG34843.1 hypothetical protein [Halomarina oriensis]